VAWRDNLTATNITAAGVIVYTALTGAIAIYNALQWSETRRLIVETRNATDIAQHQLKVAESGQRAWLMPVDMKVKKKLKAGSRSVFINLDYVNQGSQPALGVQFNVPNFGIIDTPSFYNYWVNLVQHSKNNTCIGLDPLENSEVVFPSQSAFWTKTFELFNFSTVDHLPEVISGTSRLYVHGCVAYTTLGTPHQTGFCFELEPSIEDEDTTKWTFVRCPTGFSAN
jgi:hypothetical protein